MRTLVLVYHCRAFSFQHSVRLAYVPGQRRDPLVASRGSESFCESCESQTQKHDCCHVADGIQKLRSTVFYSACVVPLLFENEKV